ncbi:septum site-determining protein Ssd [Streptomyces sp. NPDC005438]|uniref:septum site-determining protein Ssd n=1 Tax=Streptomyces sp. NPDC005438 TaxID=3156880 RepID=UPI0033A1A855
MTGTILIVTEDERLLDDLLRLCAAVGADTEVGNGREPGPGTREGTTAPRSWDRSPLVLVGDDRAAHLTGLPRRPGLLLVGRDQDDPGVWARGAGIGAEGVVMLPDGESWLAGRIADAAEGHVEAALTVGVLGGRGGAGASTLACALAVTAARLGHRTMLIDADPLGGGLDVMLGADQVKGMRWPAFAESRGRVSGDDLEEALPRHRELRLLSWDREQTVTIPPDAMRSVLAAARRRAEVVVVDLPRGLDEGAVEACAQLDLALLAVPTELRAVAAAHRVSARVRMVLRDLRLVICPAHDPGHRGLSTEEITQLLRLPLAGELPYEDGLLDHINRGRPPGSRTRGPLAGFCEEFWSRASPTRTEGGAAA